MTFMMFVQSEREIKSIAKSLLYAFVLAENVENEVYYVYTYIYLQRAGIKMVKSQYSVK